MSYGSRREDGSMVLRMACCSFDAHIATYISQRKVRKPHGTGGYIANVRSGPILGQSLPVFLVEAYASNHLL